MSFSTHLAFDLGAESGRAILGSLKNGVLSMTEIHRFPTGVLEINGSLRVNIYRIFEEIKKALALCRNTPPDTIGIDTWGVDFGFLSGDGDIISLPWSYRDGRTVGAMESFFSRCPPEKIYELTGIQLLRINSLFQLESMVKSGSETLKNAKDLLFIPDILHYLLTGVKKTEFTFATTSQLFNPKLNGWDPGLISCLGIDQDIFQEIIVPGTFIGRLYPGIQKETGLGAIPVVAVGTHDTASAVAAIPATGRDFAYISSGTWSLMGIEIDRPLINGSTLEKNFTNEGGVNGRWRFLKNIAGLWLLQQCRKIWQAKELKELDYKTLADEAADSISSGSLIDPDHPAFTSPEDMTHAITGFLTQTGQKVPQTRGQFCLMIIESLAMKYRYVLEEINSVTDHRISKIHIVGGGSRNDLLSSLTATATGLPVLAGPVEATAIGNILVQAMAMKTVSSLDELREISSRSSEIKTFEPSSSKKPLHDETFGRFRAIVESAKTLRFT